MPRLGRQEVYRLGPDSLDIGAGGVKMRVVRHHVARLAHDVEQNAFRRASLVSGDDVGITDDVLNRILEADKAAAAGVALIALHDCRPLVRGHGTGAGVSEQVDENIVGRKQKKIVMRGAQQAFPLLARGPANRFNALDAKWLDDGFGGHAE